MSHFYGTVVGQAGEAGRRGSAKTGVKTHAASWDGAIRVELHVNDNGQDCYTVKQVPWKGKGVETVIAWGVLGQKEYEVCSENALPSVVRAS